MRRTLLAAALCTALLAVGRPAAADCAGPTIELAQREIAPGDDVTLVGSAWGDNCYDTGNPHRVPSRVNRNDINCNDINCNDINPTGGRRHITIQCRGHHHDRGTDRWRQFSGDHHTDRGQRRRVSLRSWGSRHVGACSAPLIPSHSIRQSSTRRQPDRS